MVESDVPLVKLIASGETTGSGVQRVLSLRELRPELKQDIVCPLSYQSINNRK